MLNNLQKAKNFIRLALKEKKREVAARVSNYFIKYKFKLYIYRHYMQ